MPLGVIQERLTTKAVPHLQSTTSSSRVVEVSNAGSRSADVGLFPFVFLFVLNKKSLLPFTF
ncbi:hypothetical protein Scep_006691 [Stephania cephalantha]|uniref:Uncharacterized protein n=1 Tax=Stephania cephalantha TaxID=152367 RepID=A0AAP0KAD3_9MAGN